MSKWWDRDGWWHDPRALKAWSLIMDDYTYNKHDDLWYDSEGFAVSLEDILGKVEDEDNNQ